MNESNPCDAALAELLTLTMSVDGWGAIRYHNHLGQLHRVLGPAFISADGHKYWYQMGLRHRTDGPAVEWPGGIRVWFINNEEFTEEEFNGRLKSI